MMRLIVSITVAALLLTLTPTAYSPPQNTIQTLDDLFQTLSSRIPGFAGFHYQNETLVISMARPPDGLTAVEVSQMASVLASVEAFEVLKNILEGRYVIDHVQYSFNQLAQWRNQIINRPELHGLVTALDVDEVGNRLFIGVASPEQIQVVRDVLEAIGIPADAYHIEQLVIEPLVGLRDYVRPVKGGLQIAFSFYLCTLGFNAIRNGVQGYVTNDHCTDNMGQVDGTNHYQPSVLPGYLIGVETIDPPFFTGGICPAGRRCRYSDSAFGQYASSVPFALGKIARTAGLGSLDIVGEWTIVSEAASTVAGQTLNKVGRTTGWTQGQVTNTCVSTFVANTDVVRICQHFVQAGSGPGDSGSPVFKILDPTAYTVELHGILWGGSGGTVFVFSPISQIESELGPLETTFQSPSITVISPNGGENWQIGETHQIMWTSQNLAGNVDILLSRDGGTSWETLFTNTSNTGEVDWTVTGPSTSSAKIRVRSSSNPSIYDDSDSFFNISFTLTVLSPNGGETWQVGTSQTITWSSPPEGTVRILISRDGGTSWQTITSTTANDGSYTWLVTSPPTNTALIKIQSNENPTVYDQSDSIFTIIDTISPTVRVVAPNGGESLKAGRIHTIRWVASDAGGIQRVIIQFSGDGGASWQTIADLNGNSGYYRWRVPRQITSQGLIKIIVYDYSGNMGQDTSDGYFRIRR